MGHWCPAPLITFTFYMLEFVQLRCNSDLEKKGTEKCGASEVSRDQKT